ncbi:MAG: copper amine oxidase N-terminal domain-containing protein, partial [Defluviitaleaceae bacterium]|nr:copper amine oxidase N-terminal domain-containing protein [Defluviitaleaceae bacterium]
MKKIFLFVIFVTIIFVSNTAAQDLPDERLKNAVVVSLDANQALVNGALVRVDQNRRVAPYIDSADRTNVPLRFISEAFAGVKVEWNEDSKTADIIDGNTTISLREGGNSMTILRGGSRDEISFDSRVERHHNRLFVPLRAIAEALRKEIFFDRGLIIISDTKNFFDAQKDREILDAICDLLGVLPTVGNAENFERIVSEILGAPGWYGFDDFDVVMGEMPQVTPVTPQASPAPRREQFDM